MDRFQPPVLNSPPELALAAIGIVLMLSLAGPPWLRIVGHGQHDPSLLDRWKLFSWLHPFSAASLRWGAVLAAGIMVCAIAIAVAQRHDILGRAKQVVEEALHRT